MVSFGNNSKPIQNYCLYQIAPYRVDTYEENLVLQRKENSGSGWFYAH